MGDVLGIHHITAIAGDPRENLAFYAGLLGMRLVKRSVNQDDPGTYHLFYADAAGHPGTDLTFFPWLHVAAGRPGTGMINEVMLAVPPASLDYWSDRLGAAGVATGAPEVRFGARVLPFTDPHGMPVALVETDDERRFTPWVDGPVPVDRQVRGLHGVRLWEETLVPTRTLLEGVLGWSAVGTDGEWHRFAADGAASAGVVDVREVPGAGPGRMGRGSVHHVAFRVADDAMQDAVRRRVAAAGRRPTPVIDRFWFKSVYFTEPGGVLFELATDGPGFAVDEDAKHLGERLVLPPWLEPQRERIAAALPALDLRLD
jgi:glyoxalase family protein